MLPDLVLQNIYEFVDTQITKLNMEKAFNGIMDFQDTFQSKFNTIPKLKSYQDIIEVDLDISPTKKMKIMKNNSKFGALYEVSLVNFDPEDDRFVIPERFRQDFNYELPVFLHTDYQEYNNKCRDLLEMRPRCSQETYRVCCCGPHVSVDCNMNGVYVYLPYLVKIIQMSNGYEYISHDYKYSIQFPISKYYWEVTEKYMGLIRQKQIQV
jgi:hypothetical protein